MNPQIYKAATDPISALRERAEESGRALALAFSSYFPLEILDALGLEAAWLPNMCAADYPRAQAEIQTFVCNPVRAAIEAVLAANLPLALIACTTGCDARLAMPDIFRLANVPAAVLTLRLPVAVGTERSLAQANQALAEFVQDAQVLLGRQIDADMLCEATKQREAGRAFLRRLFEGLGDECDAVDAYALALASQVLSPAVFLRVASNVVLDKPGTRGVRVMLCGSSLPSLAFVHDIQALGAQIVADDTCTGARAASRTLQPFGQGFGAVLEAIARSLANRPFHGPVMVEPNNARIRRLVECAQRRHVRLVIYALYKFCDPHAFEIPLLQNALQKAGVAFLSVEVDREPFLSARDRMRLQTALEAFL